ncbi:MAG: tetratricopeptide repeat protein [Acidobacteriota bacterium]
MLVTSVGSRVVGCLLAASLSGGCVAGAPRSQRFIQRPSETTSGAGAEADEAKGARTAARARKESLLSSIEAFRQLVAATPPPAQATPLPTIEGRDPELSSARLLLAVLPSADNQRRVAAAYMQLGVLDAAYDHFKAALRLNPRDAASFDGLARVWRDWGLPNVALGDAHRAIYYAPSSATVYNTLGTILQKLGQTAAAEAAFVAALQRDPDASYALNNLCYVKFLQGQSEPAIVACTRAVGLEPGLAAAHNNLGLAYWAGGDRMSATQAFASTKGAGAARYNTGIALLGSRLFEQAAEAFDDADAVNPPVRQARQRALQARTLAAGTIDGPQ